MDIFPVKGRLLAASRTKATPTAVAKIARIIRLAARLSQWIRAMVINVSHACTSNTIHFTPLTEDSLGLADAFRTKYYNDILNLNPQIQLIKYIHKETDSGLGLYL
jgi:hypothetical protein